MDRINSIVVENIRGISQFHFNELLIPNKLTIFVAPNGRGKSSLALAFSKLRSKRLILEKGEIHKKDATMKPTIKIGFESNEILECNEIKNDISKKLDIYVLKCNLYAKATKKRFGEVINATGNLCIKPVEIVTIPPKHNFDYSVSNIQKHFGKNSKLFSNLQEYLLNEKFVSLLRNNYKTYLKMKSSSTIRKEIDCCLNYMNRLDGPRYKIIQEIDLNKINDIIKNNYLIKFIEFTKSNLKCCYPEIIDDKEQLIIAIQLYFIFNNNSEKLDSVLNYFEYLNNKTKVVEMIQSCNTSWIDTILPTEEKGKLILNMPDAIELSNGERDLITFIAELSKFRFKNNNKDLVIIIDELFDYLDEANLLITQYILTNYICQYKSENKKIYPIILTHLNPYHFNTFIANDKKVYFFDKKNKMTKNNAIEKIILHRNNDTICKDLSLYFLHYNPSEKDLSSKFIKLGLDAKYAKSFVLKDEALNNLKRYCEEKKSYDPLLVGLGLRIILEESIYNKLPSSSAKDVFLEAKKGTNIKFEWAIENGVNVPEIYFLLGILYNDILHITEKSLVKLDILHNNLKNKQVLEIVKFVYYSL